MLARPAHGAALEVVWFQQSESPSAAEGIHIATPPPQTSAPMRQEPEDYEHLQRGHAKFQRVHACGHVAALLKTLHQCVDFGEPEEPEDARKFAKFDDPQQCCLVLVRVGRHALHVRKGGHDALPRNGRHEIQDEPRLQVSFGKPTSPHDEKAPVEIPRTEAQNHVDKEETCRYEMRPRGQFQIEAEGQWQCHAFKQDEAQCQYVPDNAQRMVRVQDPRVGGRREPRGLLLG
mmetsp:Transcript_65295/g.199798  ORF Transcript_65295/g.199798 Transcript_65295/m.199798 type:complete len:232 (+) Transcript_65295:1293-1988(+)